MPKRRTSVHAVMAVQADQNHTPSASGAVELLSRCRPSQWPMAKAMIIITKPLMAEAVPAAPDDAAADAAVLAAVLEAVPADAAAEDAAAEEAVPQPPRTAAASAAVRIRDTIFFCFIQFSFFWLLLSYRQKKPPFRVEREGRQPILRAACTFSIFRGVVQNAGPAT